MDRRAYAGGPPTLIDRLEGLGSKILYEPNQDSTDYVTVLERVSDCVYRQKLIVI